MSGSKTDIYTLTDIFKTDHMHWYEIIRQEIVLLDTKQVCR